MANSKIVLFSGVVFLAIILIAWIQFKPVEEVIEEVPVEEIAEEVVVATSTKTILGTSIEGRDIVVETFGTGDTDLLFIGGIHGGYEWNSSLLGYEMIDYLHENADIIPENLTVHIVPNLNPDGLFEATNIEGKFVAADIPNVDIHTTGIGRFNANAVDLNRNFDCRWSPEGVWRGNSVGTGGGPFSEPEAQLIRDYILETNPVAGIVWHSKANNVYGSECGDPVTADTLTLMSTYAQAGSYGEVPVFDAYPVTGAIEDWMASLGIASVSVELETRTDSEFERNLAGTLATFELYSN